MNPHSMSGRAFLLVAVSTLAVASMAACGESSRDGDATTHVAAAAHTDGTPMVLADSTIVSHFDAAGVTEPMQQATVSTKLMGTVTAVQVKEGDVVRAGQLLAQIDARDLTAKAGQLSAAIADAEAMQLDATRHAARFRALYADSAATRAQYDAAETGVARANAAVSAARAGAAELEAMRSYASIRAPFSGVVTSRHADAGAFAAPGMPLVTVQDVSSLRVSAAAPAEAVRGLKRGARVTAVIDGAPVPALVEGVVPSGAGNVFTVNAIITNRDGARRSGSAVVLQLPLATRAALLVPQSALVRDGDLVGVIVRTTAGDARRWVRIGAHVGSTVEVTSGLSAGETIIVPSMAAKGGV
jgi:RND family efflux transporter MFP subunit